MINLFWLLCAFALVLLNGFFVAAEFGMVKLRSTRVEVIKKTHGLRGAILARVHKHLDAYLSACQLGITLASLGLGWIGEPAFADLLHPLFAAFKIQSTEVIHGISLVTAFLIISYLHIVIGELMPKSMAIRRPERISLWTSIPLFMFYWIMYPVIWFFNASSNVLLKISGLRSKGKKEGYYSTDELKLILSASHLHGELTEEESEILEHTLEFTDLEVTDVMRPADEMISLEIHQPIEASLQKIVESRYSRYPIYDHQKHQYVGIIHVKDLFATLYTQKSITDIKPLMRPILKVSSHLPALDLLRKFRGGMPHFALVYSGNHSPIGFVTWDNLLHVLVGRIKDEFHRTRDDWTVHDDGSLTMKANSSIYMLERALDIDIALSPEDEETINTISGLILARTETLPQTGERIKFKRFEIVIEKMDGPRIVQVRIYPKKKKK